MQLKTQMVTVIRLLKRQTVAPSVQWDITDKTKLLLQADYLHDNRLADQGFPTDPITGKPVKTNPKTFMAL